VRFTKNSDIRIINKPNLSMKKLVLTVFAACLVFAASAQFKGGIKAGANLANLGGDVEDTDMLFAFHFGLYGQFGLSEALTLQPEVLYYGAGAKSGDDDLKINYLAIPVMFKYNVGETLNIQAGPQLGLLMGTDPSELKDALKGTDFGLNLGLGAGFGKFSVDARYSIGLANIYDGDEVEIKNNVIQISLGYQLFGE
jgi:hypothetical protein